MTKPTPPTHNKPRAPLPGHVKAVADGGAKPGSPSAVQAQLRKQSHAADAVEGLVGISFPKTTWTTTIGSLVINHTSPLSLWQRLGLRFLGWKVTKP